MKRSAMDNPVAVNQRTGAYIFCGECGAPKRRQPGGQTSCPPCKNFAYKMHRRNNTPLGESMRKASREYQRRKPLKGGRVYQRGETCKRGHSKVPENLNRWDGCRICKRVTNKARRMGIKV